MIDNLGKKILLFITTWLSVLVLAWCLGKTITNTSTISLKYTANFEDNSLFESKEITGIVLWQWQLSLWLEEWLLWLKKWDTKQITVTPDKWYGKYYDPGKVQKLSKEIVWNLEIWSILKVWNEDAVVIWLEWDNLIIDINPKNTRQELNYNVEILDVK